MSFDELAIACERVAATPSRNRKVAILGAYLGQQSEANLVRAVRFLCGQPLAGDGKLSLGHSALREALMEATGWDLETVRLCYREVGDTGETIGLLLHSATRNQPLTLEQAEQEFLQIFAVLQQRLQRKTVSAELMAKISVRFIAYDQDPEGGTTRWQGLPQPGGVF